MGNHGGVHEPDGLRTLTIGEPIPLAPLTPRRRRRLERAQRYDARLNAHPWLHAIPVTAVAFLTPLMMSAVSAAPVTRNIGAAVAAAIGTLLAARGFGPWAAHRRVVRLTRRYRSAGPSA